MKTRKVFASALRDRISRAEEKKKTARNESENMFFLGKKCDR